MAARTKEAIHIMVTNAPVSDLKNFKRKCADLGIPMLEQVESLMEWVLNSPTNKLGKLIARARSIEKKPKEQYTVWHIQYVPDQLKIDFKVWCARQKLPMAKVLIALSQLFVEGKIP